VRPFERRLPLLIAMLVLAAGAGQAGCGGDDGGDGGGAGDGTALDLTIGDLVPLSGDLAAFGRPGRKAADLAVEQIEAAVKEAGTGDTVEIVHEDERIEPGAAARAARKLVDTEKATCLTGPWGSSVLQVARSVTIPAKVLELSPSATGDDITGAKDDGLLNRTAPPDRLQGPALANVVEDALGGAQGRTVNIGARNDSYGTGLTDTFSRAWQQKGGRIGERVLYDPGQPSYNTEAQKISSGDPDAYMIVDLPETFRKLGPALVRTGRWDPRKTFITDGLASSALSRDAGRAATEGMRGTAPGAPDTGAAAVAFDKLFRDAPGPERQTFDAHIFDAVILCYLTAVAAGSTDGADMAAKLIDLTAPGGEKYTWEQLPAAIEALRNGDDIDYDGASGPIDLNRDGDPTAGVYDLFRYREGQVEIYDETPIAATPAS
jgi:ABC-type branched-subunit amino acid transport system substrate-binding protein